MAESILKKEMNIIGKKRVLGGSDNLNHFSDLENLPFLAVETDGSPFPQLVEANLEAFILQSMRVHERILKAKSYKTRRPVFKHSLRLYEIVTGNSFAAKKTQR
jgi:hypothetical protein